MTRKIRVMTFSSIALSWLSYCFNRILTLAKTTECLINSHLLAVTPTKIGQFVTLYIKSR